MAYSYGSIIPAPTSKPIAVTRHTTLNTSYAITLNTKTTGIEVTANTKPLLLRWNDTATTSAFDGVIPADSSKVFMVPSGTTTVNIIEDGGGAQVVVIEF